MEIKPCLRCGEIPEITRVHRDDGTAIYSTMDSFALRCCATKVESGFIYEYDREGKNFEGKEPAFGWYFDVKDECTKDVIAKWNDMNTQIGKGVTS